VNCCVLGWVKGYGLGLGLRGLRYLRLGGHYGSIEGISTIALKLNKEYKPLTVAIFLVIGGLVFGSLFVSKGAGVEETRVSGGSSFIPQAEGAEVDSAALAVQRAPFLSSVNNGGTSLGSAQDSDILYLEGALKDPGSFVSVKTASASTQTKKQLVSGVIYQIAVGDTLQSISASFGVPMNKIVQFNPSVNFSSLDPGISIIIPGEKDINVFAGQD
jgi:LysM repeat protein